jgi:hypothetical protein
MELAANKVFRNVSAVPANYAQGNYNIYGEVRVEKTPGSGIFDITLSCKLTPDHLDEATFELQDGVSDYFPLPDFNPYSLPGIQKITDNQVRAQFWTAESYGDPEVLQSLVLSDTFSVLNGGIPKQYNVDFFEDFLPTFKAFLNWHPGEKRVDLNQPELLHFYAYHASITSLNLLGKVYYSDNTSQTTPLLSLTGITAGSIYRMPAGFTQLELNTIDGAKTAIRYELWLEDQATNIVSEVRNYILEQISRPYTRYWMFINSLGMWEIMRAEGKNILGISLDRERSTGYLQQGYDRTKGEIRNRVLGSTDTLDVSTGFFTSREEAVWAKEILLSPKVFLLTDTQRIPYNILTNEYQPYQDADYNWFLRFEAELAYNNIKHGNIQ